LNNLFPNRSSARLSGLRQLFLFYCLTVFCCICIIPQALAQNSELLAAQKQPDTAWITFTNDTAAFSVKFPTKPFSMKKQVPAKIGKDSVKFLLNLYASADSLTGLTYVVRYNDYPAGTFLSDHSKLLESFEKEFAAKGKIAKSPRKVSVDGIDGWELGITYDLGFNGIVRIFVRGNRVYVLLEQVQEFVNGDNKADIFFNSFHLRPFIEPAYYTFRSAKRGFSIKLPEKPVVKQENVTSYSSYLTGEELYLSTNPNSGASYSFAASRLSPYYRADNIDSVFKESIKLIIGYRDSLFKLDTIKINGVSGREFITIDRFTKAKKRSRIFIDWGDFFYLTAMADESELFGKTSGIFFNSLILTKPSHSFDFSSSKAAKICADISSPDTLVSKRAAGAIHYYHFKPDELPLVYAALMKNYPDDTTEDGVRIKLINKLRHEGNDSTVTFLVNLYPQLTGKDDVKATILNVLPFLNPKKSYSEYLRLLSTDPPYNTRNIYRVMAGLTDSISFAEKNFVSVVPLIRYDNFRPKLLSIANQVAEIDSPAYKKVISSNYNALMRYADADIKDYLKKKDSVGNEYSAVIYEYMRIMAQIKDVDLTKQLTDTYLQARPKGTYAVDAIVARIANGLPNDETLIKFYMDSLDTRYDLIKAYYKHNEPGKIPKLYLQQDEFAKLCLYKYVTADEDRGSPSNLLLLGTVTDSGKIYFVFKFSIADDTDNKELIGIAGPSTPGATTLNFDNYHAFSSYDNLNDDWHLQAQQMIKPLTDQYK